MTCVIGLSNTLRGDDAVASYVCKTIEAQNHADVAIFNTQQLDIVWAEKLKNFAEVIILHASVDKKEVEFKKVETKDTEQLSYTHHIHPGILANLTNRLYQTNIDYYTCIVEGYRFEFEEQLSEKAICNADKVITLLNKRLSSRMIK